MESPNDKILTTRLVPAGQKTAQSPFNGVTKSLTDNG